MEETLIKKVKEFALGRAEVLEQNKNNPRYTRLACSVAIDEISNILAFLEKEEDEAKYGDTNRICKEHTSSS